MRVLGTLVGVCGLAVVGCSSSSNDPFGPSPDFGHVEAQFQQPTGTFAKGSESKVFGQASQQQASTAGSFSVGGTPVTSSSGTATQGGVTSQALRFLDTTQGGTNFCPALQSGAESGSCACPSGGSLAYDLSGLQQLRNYQSGPIDVTLRLHAAACASQDEMVDGSEFIHIASSGTPSAKDLRMLVDAHLTLTKAGRTDRMDLDFEYNNGQIWFSVTVDDGNVVVGTENWDSTTKTGTIVARDRNETWTCTLTAGKGTCTSDKGTVRDVDGA